MGRWREAGGKGRKWPQGWLSRGVGAGVERCVRSRSPTGASCFLCQGWMRLPQFGRIAEMMREKLSRILPSLSDTLSFSLGSSFPAPPSFPSLLLLLCSPSERSQSPHCPLCIHTSTLDSPTETATTAARQASRRLKAHSHRPAAVGNQV